MSGLSDQQTRLVGQLCCLAGLLNVNTCGSLAAACRKQTPEPRRAQRLQFELSHFDNVTDQVYLVRSVLCGPWNQARHGL